MVVALEGDKLEIFFYFWVDTSRGRQKMWMWMKYSGNWEKNRWNHGKFMKLKWKMILSNFLEFEVFPVFHQLFTLFRVSANFYVFSLFPRVLCTSFIIFQQNFSFFAITAHLNLPQLHIPHKVWAINLSSTTITSSIPWRLSQKALNACDHYFHWKEWCLQVGTLCETKVFQGGGHTWKA